MKRLAGDNIWLIIFICLILFLVPASVVIAKWLSSSEYYGSSVNLAFPEFRASDAKGVIYDQSDLANQLSLVFFGNTRCASICAPRVNLFKRIELELSHLPDKGLSTRFIFITLDPEFDQAQRLDDYFQAHDDDFIALRILDDSFFMRLNAQLGFSAKPLAQGQFQHSDYIYLLEPNGNVRLSYSGTALDAKRIAQDIHSLVKQSKLRGV